MGPATDSYPILKTDPTTFLQALQQKQFVHKDREGKWVPYQNRLLSWLTPERYRLTHLFHSFTVCTARLEEIPPGVRRLTFCQPIDLTPWENAANEMLVQLVQYQKQKQSSLFRKLFGRLDDRLYTWLYKPEQMHPDFPVPLSADVVRSCKTLQRHLISLKYRMQLVRSEFDRFDATLYDQLEGLATTWKNSHPYLPNHQTLSQNDIINLNRLSCYPEFAQFLLDNQDQRDDFFKLIFQDNWDANNAVLYPAVTTLLKTCYLAPSVGFKGQNFLSTDSGTQNPSLPFVLKPGEITSVSLLDLRHFCTFETRDGKKWALTVAQVLRYFANKNSANGPFVFTDAVHLWDSQKLQQVTPDHPANHTIDLNKERYWEQLLPSETILVEEAEYRFAQAIPCHTENAPPLKNPDGTLNWILTVRASVKDTQNKKDVAGAHGFIEVMIPDEGNNSYKVYDFGKFAQRYPVTPLDFLSFFADTVPAVIESPDSNQRYTFRKQTWCAWALSRAEGARLMYDVLKPDLERSLKAELDFTFMIGACSKWAQNIPERLQVLIRRQLIDPKQDKIFRTKMLRVAPQVFPIKQIYQFILLLPKKIQTAALKFFLFFFGPWRGPTFDGHKYSIMTSREYKKMIAFVPSMLAIRHERAKAH